MKDNRGIDRGPNSHTTPGDARDTKRDVLAMYRAALARDADAMSAVISNTRCLGCLVSGVAQIGLWLAARDEHDYGPHHCGYEFTCFVLSQLDELQCELDGEPPPPEYLDPIR